MSSQQTTSSNNNLTFKIALVGDAGVGKTTFLKRLAGGNFDPCYNSTQGTAVSTVRLYTNTQTITCEMVDVAGQEFHSHTKRHEAFAGVQGVIAMFSLTSKLSRRNLKAWVVDLTTIVSDTKVVVVGNKHDIESSDDMMSSFSPVKGYGILFRMSVKNGDGVDLPLKELVRSLMNKPDLCFVDTPPTPRQPEAIETDQNDDDDEKEQREQQEVYHLRALLKIRDEENFKLRAQTASVATLEKGNQLRHKEIADLAALCADRAVIIKQRDTEIANLKELLKKQQQDADRLKSTVAELNTMVVDACQSLNGLMTRVSSAVEHE